MELSGLFDVTRIRLDALYLDESIAHAQPVLKATKPPPPSDLLEVLSVIVRLAREHPEASAEEVSLVALGEIRQKGLPLPTHRLEVDLLRAIVDIARREPGLGRTQVYWKALDEPLHVEPRLLRAIIELSLWQDERDAWRLAWQRAGEGSASPPTPPDRDLFLAIYTAARRMTADAFAGNRSGVTDQEVLAAAFKGLPPWSETIDENLLEALVRGAVQSPMARADDVYRSAWATLGGVTVHEPPERVIRAVVYMARKLNGLDPDSIALGALSAPGHDSTVPARTISSHALAAQLAEDLAEGDPREDVDHVEPALLRALLRNAIDHPAETAMGVWWRAIAERSGNDLLPWPPWPRPDEALLKALVQCAREQNNTTDFMLDVSVVALGRGSQRQAMRVAEAIAAGYRTTFASELGFTALHSEPIKIIGTVRQPLCPEGTSPSECYGDPQRDQGGGGIPLVYVGIAVAAAVVAFPVALAVCKTTGDASGLCTVIDDVGDAIWSGIKAVGCALGLGGCPKKIVKPKASTKKSEGPPVGTGGGPPGSDATSQAAFFKSLAESLASLCPVYEMPLAQKYLTSTYLQNAQCACLETPRDAKNDCVRLCLQLKLLQFLGTMQGSGTPIDPCVQLGGANCYESHCQSIWQHHVDCYSSCGCGAKFIDYRPFEIMCTMPFSCSFVGGSISMLNSCA